MLPKAFLHSIFQAIDGESLFNEFVGKYFYSLFEIICGRTDRQTDRRTKWFQYTPPPPTSLGRSIITESMKHVFWSDKNMKHCSQILKAHLLLGIVMPLADHSVHRTQSVNSSRPSDAYIYIYDKHISKWHLLTSFREIVIEIPTLSWTTCLKKLKSCPSNQDTTKQ